MLSSPNFQVLLSDGFNDFQGSVLYIDFESAFGQMSSHLCRKRWKRGNDVIGRPLDFKLDLDTSPLSAAE